MQSREWLRCASGVLGTPTSETRMYGCDANLMQDSLLRLCVLGRLYYGGSLNTAYTQLRAVVYPFSLGFPFPGACNPCRFFFTHYTLQC